MQPPPAVRACLEDWGLSWSGGEHDAPPASKNLTFLCRSREGRRVLVKVADVHSDTGVVWEGQVLSALAGMCAGVRDAPLLPAVCGFDARRGVLALEWISDAEMLYAYHRRTRRYPLELARQVGRGLGAIHRETFGKAPPSSGGKEMLWNVLWPSPAFYATLSPAAVTLIGCAQSNPEAVRAMMVMRQEHTGGPACFLHGDFRQANVLRVGRRVAFLDWELAHWGEPARDVGMLFADYVAAWVSPLHAMETLEQEALQRFLRTLLGAYVAARAGTLADGTDFERRVLQWTGEGLLHHVYTRTHTVGAFDETAARLTAAGLELLARPGQWRHLLLGGPA
jgi:tRNA A-37 threonylcarbamoyl transferase component Bud32